MLFYLSHPEEQVVLKIPLKIFDTSLMGEQGSVLRLLDVFRKPESFELEFERISFQELLTRIAQTNVIYYLTPEGQSINDVIINSSSVSNRCFILGSQHDLSQEQEEALLKVEIIPVSLGKLDYLASHVITIICDNLIR